MTFISRLFLAFTAAPVILFAQVNEQQAAKKVYAHLLIHDPNAAVESARKSLELFPESKSLQLALIRALAEQGDEMEVLHHWKQLTSTFAEEKNNRLLLEVLSWGVLNKGEHSSQLIIRLNALLGVSFTHDARAIPVLLSQMRDSNALVRTVAIRMSTNFGDAPLLEELSRMLKTEKVWYVRLEVLRAIGAFRIKSLRSDLKEIIGNPKTIVEEKMMAIMALVNIYDSIELEELKSLARSDRAGLRQLACDIVGHLEFINGLGEIITLLGDTSSDVRMSALNTIGLLGTLKYKDQKILDLIQKNLVDSDPSVAITAAWLAMLLDSSLGEKELAKWMEHTNPELRRLASAALAKTGKRGVSLSYKMMKESKDPYVKVNLALALISQRKYQKIACDVLYDVFTTQKEKWMWDSQVNSLFRSLSPSTVKHIEQIPHYPSVVDQMVRLDILSVLSMMCYPKAQDAVKGFLQYQTWGVTGAAAATLLQEGDEQSLDLVRNLLTDPDKNIRVQAAFILAVLGSDPAAIKVLQEAYWEVDREIKVHILEAIGHVGDLQSIPFLIDILHEPFQVLRVVAASALIQCLYH